jgi:hypothetical protein
MMSQEKVKPRFLPIYQYESFDDLLEPLEQKVIAPAEAKAEESRKR